jgi:hypothetical protein
VKVVFKIDRPLWRAVQADLDRPHRFAHERVGFVSCKPAALDGGLLLLADTYHPIADDDYEDVRGDGAMMGPGAIRKALQIAYGSNVSMIHVHRHEHRGVPGFSRTDVRENAKFVPDFFKVRPKLPHGAVVMSHDAMAGEVWEPETMHRRPIDELALVGRPSWFLWARK